MSGFIPQWLSGKTFTCNAGAAGDVSSIPGLGRSPGRGNGNPQHCSYLENSKDRAAWRATVHGSQRVGHDWAYTQIDINNRKV